MTNCKEEFHPSHPGGDLLSPWARAVGVCCCQAKSLLPGKAVSERAEPSPSTPPTAPRGGERGEGAGAAAGEGYLKTMR